MNYPTVEINNEFPKRVFFTSSVNLESVPREPDSTYSYPQSFRATLPEVIQPSDDSQNVSWHIVSMGMTPNAVHNPPEPNVPLAGAEFKYRLVVDPDLLRNSLLYGKLDNPVNGILTNPTPTTHPTGSIDWPNADIAAHALHYDMAHLARIALVTQVYEDEAALTLNHPVDFKSTTDNTYNLDTVQFAILDNRLVRGPYTHVLPISLNPENNQNVYDLKAFTGSMEQPIIDDVQAPSRGAINGTLHDYWKSVALPAICANLSSGPIELEEPYFPTREKFLTRLFEKANLSSLFRCHIPDFSDDLTNRVTLELKENATLHFFQAHPNLRSTLDTIRRRIGAFCSAYIHYCTDKDYMHERLGVAPTTARPVLLKNQESYFLSNTLRDTPIPTGAVFPYNSLSVKPGDEGKFFHQSFIYDQANALANRLIDYFFSITVIQDIILELNPTAQIILGNHNTQNWVEQLSRSDTKRIEIEGRGPETGNFLPIWSTNISSVNLQFQKNCTQISSFTKNNAQDNYSYTPPIPMGEYIRGGDNGTGNTAPFTSTNLEFTHNIWMDASYRLAIPFTLQSILDYYVAEPLHFYVNVTDAWWRTIGAVPVAYEPPVEPSTDWFTFNRVTAELTYVATTPTQDMTPALNTAHTDAISLEWTGLTAKADATFLIQTMCEDGGIFSLISCYTNLLPIFKTITNGEPYCNYGTQSSHFLLYTLSNYLRFAGDYHEDDGYTLYEPLTVQPPCFSKMDSAETEKFRHYYLHAASPFIQRGNSTVSIFTFENNFIGLEWVDVTFRNIVNNTMVASSAENARNSQISTRLFMPTESRTFMQNSQIATNMCFGSMELRTLDYLLIDIVDPSGRHSLQNARLYFEIEFNQLNVTPEESERADNFQNWTPQTPDDLENILSRKKRRRSTIRLVS